MGHEACLCHTTIDPVVVGAVVAPAEAEAPAQEVMAMANAAVGTHPRLVPLGRPTTVVPECQRMGMVKAEANNTIHRKPFTRNDTPASIEPNRRANRLGQIRPQLTLTRNANTKTKHKTPILVYVYASIRTKMSTS